MTNILSIPYEIALMWILQSLIVWSFNIGSVMAPGNKLLPEPIR